MWRCRFNPWGRSPGEGNDNPPRYSCLENPHGQRSLAGYGPWGHRVGHSWGTKQQQRCITYHFPILLPCRLYSSLCYTVGHCCLSILYVVVVWLLSCVWLFVTPWTTAHQASLSITSSRSLPKLMSIESAMPSNHLILCRPLLLLPSIFPNIRVFSNESALHIRWPKYWSFSFDISPSNEHPGLTSFRMDWLALLAVHGTLKSLLQHIIYLFLN